MALLDKPPPSRWTIKEIKGRLVVFDNETGAPPLSAAERMALLDEQAGHRPATAPTTRSGNPSHFAALPTGDTPPSYKGSPRTEQTQRKSQTPWDGAAVAAKSTPQPQSHAKGSQNGTLANPQTAAMLRANQAAAFTTNTAWDSKGPRNIRLGEVGRQHVSKILFITLIGLIIFEIFIWSQDAGSAVLVHALLVAILWGQRAEIGRRIVDQLVALDEQSQR